MGRARCTSTRCEPVRYADTDEEYRYDGLVIASGPGRCGPKRLADRRTRPPHPVRPGRCLGAAPGPAPGPAGGDRRRRPDRLRESACAVARMARDCVLIDSKQQVMSRALGEVRRQYVTEEVARDGVELRLGRRSSGSTGAGAAGCSPSTTVRGRRPTWSWPRGGAAGHRLAGGTGLDISDGVLCDEHLRVVGARGRGRRRYGGPLAQPSVRHRAAPGGQWIRRWSRAGPRPGPAGQRPPGPAGGLVPRYWSEQFGLRIQVCGEVPDGSRR